MNYANLLRDSFESIEDYRKIVLLLFLIQYDKNLLNEIGFSKNDFNRLSSEFKNILIAQHEEDMEYIKKQEESNNENFLDK